MKPNSKDEAVERLDKAAVAYNSKASKVEADMGIIASNLAIAESNTALALATTQASINTANAIASINISGIIETNEKIVAALNKIIELLQPKDKDVPVG